MLEHLMDPERPYGEPAYSKLSVEIADLQQRLDDQLDEQGQAWLEELSYAYHRQGNAMLPDAFADGFWMAVELMLEFKSWTSQ